MTEEKKTKAKNKKTTKESHSWNTTNNQIYLTKSDLGLNNTSLLHKSIWKGMNVSTSFISQLNRQTS